MITQENIKKSRFLIVGEIDIAQNFHDTLLRYNLAVTLLSPASDIDASKDYDVVSIIVGDDLALKADCLSRLRKLYPEALLTVNIDAIDLAAIQEASNTDVIGLNLSYPMQSSPFMEIIRTAKNSDQSINLLETIGVDLWNLDPYVANGISARNYMLAAMTREALHLVDNGYASAESIDRACRNDAGYYMPFTGNFLYMDLMGTIAYALVMKDLNPELAKSDSLPQWMEQLVADGKLGMKSGEGIYSYNAADYEAWQGIMKDFSVDVAQLINKYKKDYDTI